MKLFAVLALAQADPIPFDAAAICCDSLIVKGFDPVEGTYLLGEGLFYFQFFLQLSRHTGTPLARPVQTRRRGRLTGGVVVLLVHANVRLLSKLAPTCTRRLGVWRSRARK